MAAPVSPPADWPPALKSQAARQLAAALPGRDGEQITLGALAAAAAEQGPGLLLLLFALPMCLPVGMVPGMAAAVSVPMTLAGLALMRGHPQLPLPAGVARRSLSRAALARMLVAADRPLGWLERWSSRRAHGLLTGPGRRLVGVMVLVMAGLLILPVPTGNLPAAAAVGLFGLGLLRGDGLLAGLGHALGLVAVGWNAAVAAALIGVGIALL